MASEPPENDIRSKWQNQPNETTRMSVEELRQKAWKLQRKARREVLLLYGIALLFVVFFGRAFVRSHETLSRIGLGLLIVSALYLPYQAQKRLWPRNPAAEVASTTGLESYRRELERRRDYTRHIWRLLGPLLFGLGVFLLPAVIKAFKNSGLWLNILPVAVLLVFWATLAIPLRKRQLRKLRRELDALDALKS
jgi:hypothetical protein